MNKAVLFGTGTLTTLGISGLVVYVVVNRNDEVIAVVEEKEVPLKETPKKQEEPIISNGDREITGTGFNKRQEGTLTREQGKEKVDLIRDHIIKLSNAVECTGWFLDYEIPKNKGAYPKKWFIGTNLHCVNDTFFNHDNYETTLPKYIEKDEDVTTLVLSKERLDVANVDVEFFSDKGGTYKKKLVKADAREAPEGTNPDIGTFTDYNSKLVYVAIDYLGGYRAVQKLGYKYDVPHYYKDFAVIEVNFDTELQAKRTTGDFYSKYDPVVGNKKGINYFSDELITNKTPDQLLDYHKDFFIAGYPTNSWHEDVSVSNYDESSKSASRLTHAYYNYSVKDKNGKSIIGHYNAGNFRKDKGNFTYWDDLRMIPGGYRYSLDWTRVSGGSSGTIVIDEFNNLLGINSVALPALFNDAGGVELLRSNGRFKNGKMIFPKYDLLEGEHSYRSQIEKYFLKKGIETNLSRLRKWKYRG